MDYKEIERMMPECGHFIETNVRGAKGDIFCTICDKHVAKKEQPIVLSIGNMLQTTTHFVLAKYTPETFSVRSSILTILQENNKLLNENNTLKNNLEMEIEKFNILSEHKSKNKELHDTIRNNLLKSSAIYSPNNCVSH